MLNFGIVWVSVTHWLNDCHRVHRCLLLKIVIGLQLGLFALSLIVRVLVTASVSRSLINCSEFTWLNGVNANSWGDWSEICSQFGGCQMLILILTFDDYDWFVCVSLAFELFNFGEDFVEVVLVADWDLSIASWVHVQQLDFFALQAEYLTCAIAQLDVVLSPPSIGGG